MEEDDSGEDDLLVLCSLVEEYKESLENAEALNESLKVQLERALNENHMHLEKEEQQKAVIRRLDDSVNQLVEELEHTNNLLATKDGDLQSLQHCLNVIHRKKVEVDDQAQLEQSKIIATLYAEKVKINEAYSANLKILEEYLDIINSRDSEILDLKHIISLLENEHNETVVDLSDEEKEDRIVHRPASNTSSTPSVARPVLINPSPPTTAPPERLTTTAAGITSSTTSTSSTTTSVTAVTARKLAAVRAASTAAISSAALDLSSEDENEDRGGEDEEYSPNVPVTISRNRSTRMHKRQSTGSMLSSNINNSSSRNSVGTSDEQTAAVLNKYRRYVSLNASSGGSSSTGDANSSAWSANNGRVNNNSSANSSESKAAAQALKWSDVGKHEKLFHKVDIIKNRNVHPPPGNKQHHQKQPPGSAYTASSSSSRRSLEPKFGDSANDSVNDSMEYEPDDDLLHPLHDSTLSVTDSLHSGTNASISVSNGNDNNNDNSLSDSVEVFVQIDSNPSSPERMKPAKPLFKPPFSKPTFNEFTPNSTSANASRSAKTSTKTNFDVYANKKGANYAPDPSAGANRSDTPDAKNVKWADSKRTDYIASDSKSSSTNSSSSHWEDNRSGTYKRASSAKNVHVPFPNNVGSSQVPTPGSGLNMGSFLYRKSGMEGANSSGTGRGGGALFKKRSSNASDGSSSPNYTRL